MVDIPRLNKSILQINSVENIKTDSNGVENKISEKNSLNKIVKKIFLKFIGIFGFLFNREKNAKLEKKVTANKSVEGSQSLVTFDKGTPSIQMNKSENEVKIREAEENYNRAEKAFSYICCNKIVGAIYIIRSGVDWMKLFLERDDKTRLAPEDFAMFQSEYKKIINFLEGKKDKFSLKDSKEQITVDSLQNEINEIFAPITLFYQKIHNMAKTCEMDESEKKMFMNGLNLTWGKIKTQRSKFSCEKPTNMTDDYLNTLYQEVKTTKKQLLDLQIKAP